MTIYLPFGLPAVDALRAEGVPVATEPPVADPGFVERPLVVALVNLMPDKQATELQIARLLASGRRAVRLIPTVPDGYGAGPRTADHVSTFYRPWSCLPHARIDAVIVTGAPLEKLAFENVRYWNGMTGMLDWIDAARLPALHICWAAQAALYHYYGIPKHLLAGKRFGIYPHVPPGRPDPLLHGVGLPFAMPVSRHAEVRIDDLSQHPSLRPVLVAPVAGVGIVSDNRRRATFCLNHPEYDAETLDQEVRRDRAAGGRTGNPVNYYRGGQIPEATWRNAARHLYRNWLETVAGCDPRHSADAALEWLVHAELTGSARQACGQDRPH